MKLGNAGDVIGPTQQLVFAKISLFIIGVRLDLGLEANILGLGLDLGGSCSWCASAATSMLEFVFAL